MAKLTEEELIERAVFYRKMCGEFARRFRTNRYLTPLNVAEVMNWPEEKYLSFEDGGIPFTDEEFTTICKFLGAQSEMDVFLANVDKAFPTTEESVEGSVIPYKKNTLDTE